MRYQTACWVSIPVHCGALEAISRFFFSNSKKNLPVIRTHCVSIDTKFQLYSIQIEWVIILLCFLVYFFFLLQMGLLNKKNIKAYTNRILHRKFGDLHCPFVKVIKETKFYNIFPSTLKNWSVCYKIYLQDFK